MKSQFSVSQYVLVIFIKSNTFKHNDKNNGKSGISTLTNIVSLDEIFVYFNPILDGIQLQLLSSTNTDSDIPV